MNALELSEYIIAKYDNVGDLITNKKLQKILYYIKAWGLVYFKDGIIDDDFEAWIHGPVCYSVYQEYKKFGYSPLKIDYNGLSSSQYINNFKIKFGKTQEDKDKLEMIDVVFNKYGKLTSLQLELLTHSETPWLEARESLRPIDNGNNVIKEETMKKFYSNKDK
jgi:uncharacterized phage-associated protein